MNTYNKVCLISLALILAFLTWWMIDAKLYEEELKEYVAYELRTTTQPDDTR